MAATFATQCALQVAARVILGHATGTAGNGRRVKVPTPDAYLEIGVVPSRKGVTPAIDGLRAAVGSSYEYDRQAQADDLNEARTTLEAYGFPEPEIARTLAAYNEAIEKCLSDKAAYKAKVNA